MMDDERISDGLVMMKGAGIRRVCPSERFLDPPPLLSILYMTKFIFI